jgi:hypothetical protein
MKEEGLQHGTASPDAQPAIVDKTHHLSGARLNESGRADARRG